MEEEMKNGLNGEFFEDVTGEPEDAESAPELEDIEEEVSEVTEEPDDADIEVTEEPEDAESAPELEDADEEAAEPTEEPDDADIEVTEEPEDAESAPELEDADEEIPEVTEEPAEAAGEPAKKKKSKLWLILGIVFGVILLCLIGAVALGIYATKIISLSVSPALVELTEGETAEVTAEKYTHFDELTDKLLALDESADVPALPDAGLAAIQKLEWASSDEAVATVDENGTVTAVAAGTCTVTVSTKKGISASLPVVVSEPLAEEEQMLEGIWVSALVQDLTTEEAGQTDTYALFIDGRKLSFNDLSSSQSISLDWSFDSYQAEKDAYLYYCYLDEQPATYMVYSATQDVLFFFMGQYCFLLTRYAV